jgi:hypothetical protein
MPLPENTRLDCKGLLGKTQLLILEITSVMIKSLTTFPPCANVLFFASVNDVQDTNKL